MLFLYAITAIFIAWIWVDYYRFIDIYEPEKLKYFILTFFLGALSVFIVFGFHALFNDLIDFELNGNLLNDFLYCTFQIGMLEELAKLSPFLIMYLFFRKEINEPIDYLAYICVGALGFSAFENIMYFMNHGANIISGRAILSTVGHMFFASIGAYGIILYQYKRSKWGLLVPLFYFFVGSASHGLYDFWLMFEGTVDYGILLTVLFFLEGISLFAIIMNNALNNSAYFSYKKIINVDAVSNRLLLYYSIVFLLQFVFLSMEHNFYYALSAVGISFFTIGFIVFITCLRLSRFKLIQGRWFALVLELPFTYGYQDGIGGNTAGRSLRIRGEAYNEIYLNRFYQEEFYLCPLSKRNSTLEKPRLCYIEQKAFLQNNESYYLAKIYLDESKTRYEYYLLKPKLRGKKFTILKSPIIAILRLRSIEDLQDEKLNAADLKFVEWAYPKAIGN